MSVDILVFGAHPDDIEIGLGGTVARHTAAGHAVGLCDLTAGELAVSQIRWLVCHLSLRGDLVGKLPDLPGLHAMNFYSTIVFLYVIIAILRLGPLFGFFLPLSVTRALSQHHDKS